MFKINLKESFPRLSHAPIIEAVIGVTARAETTWEESTITRQFKERLPEYPNVQAQQQIRLELKQEANLQPQQAVHDMGWLGLRCESTDKPHIAQFKRDGFSFSRLTPYQHWEQFYQEGFRLWGIYNEIAQPAEIQRIGLRFINRIKFSQGEPMEGFLENPPRPPHGMGIPINEFLHHNTLMVEGHPYCINVIQTVQPPQGEDASWGVILDIDVFTTKPIDNQDSLEQHLTKMRWLKNKVFFGSITPKTLKTLGLIK